MDGDRELTDAELARWLTTNVLGLRWELDGNWYSIATGEVFDGYYEDPTESLDDARLLEDRLRELGMEEAYIKEHCGMYDATIARPHDYDYIAELVKIRFATPREICEAVRRTWLQRKESEGTK